MRERQDILDQLAAGELTIEEASRQLLELPQPPPGTIYCKVSKRGAVSLYGLGRYPVTLYANQWQMVADKIEMIVQFVRDNRSVLKTKPPKGELLKARRKQEKEQCDSESAEMD